MNVHLDPNSPTALDSLARKFVNATIGVKAFKDQTAVWETDFRAAKDQVATIEPPSQLRVAADELVQGIDAYMGVARLYNLAAQTREVADAQPEKGQQQVEEKVQVMMQHASEWQTRAANLLGLANTKIAAYQRAWHTKGPVMGVRPTPPPSQAPAPE
jgi:hypothetical protein